MRRKEIQSEQRKLGTRISRAEERIAALEREIAELNEQLQLPENASDYEKIAGITEQLGRAQEELSAQTDEWVEASERLEELSAGE